jgi:hypothetical protein
MDAIMQYACMEHYMAFHVLLTCIINEKNENTGIKSMHNITMGL